MTVSTYPRIYKFGPWAQLMYSACCLLFVAAGAGVAAWLELDAKVRTWNLAVELIFCLPVAGFGLFTWVSVFKGKLVLFKDYLVYHGVLSTRTIYRSNVVSTRKVHVSYGNLSVVLVLKDPPKTAVRIAAFGSGDEAFAEWFEGLPNEDGEAEARAGEALLANPAFGSNPTERETQINADVNRLNYISWPCYGLVLWGWVWPHPYHICLPILMTIPVIGLLATFASHGRWTMLEDDKKGGKLSIGTKLFIAPVLVLALRAFLDDDLLDWIVPAALATAAGAGLMVLNGLIERKLTVSSATGLVVLWGLYAWGGLMYIDTSLDPSQGRPFSAKVLEMSEGKHVDTLTLTAWGTRPSGNDVSVDKSFYRQVHKGDTVCVYVFPGRLHWPWYTVYDCPKRP